ncbi:MAG: aminotransferase class I/II-fold pyridoxal phosphate-dependent enzyme [Lachnospiraceae bacterium]|nr:aminotransferase class I/II-fold pyridoxal phosphate-dependent enzyme [Lachnospiraceae bacterium]
MNENEVNTFHGSDVEALAAYYNLNANDIKSFASNVNPLGLSDRLKQELKANIDVITKYPERDYKTLRNAISKYVNAPIDNIIVGNGSTELISGIIKAVSTEDAILFAPSYSEYEREVGLNGGKIRYLPLKKELNWLIDTASLEAFIKPETGLIIMCNPNNPTGNAFNVSELRDILSIAKKHDIIVMIDETYIEFSSDIDLYSAIPLTNEFDNLVVLRGVSKFYAAPGLRLGYAITSSEHLKSSILNSKDPWSINSVAEMAGIIMFSDTDYRANVRDYTAKELEYFKNALEKTGKFIFYPSQANFYLIELNNTDKTSTDVFVHLIKQNLMIRDLSSFPYLGDNYIRIAMLSHEDNERLANVLISYV